MLHWVYGCFIYILICNDWKGTSFDWSSDYCSSSSGVCQSSQSWVKNLTSNSLCVSGWIDIIAQHQKVCIPVLEREREPYSPRDSGVESNSGREESNSDREESNSGHGESKSSRGESNSGLGEWERIAMTSTPRHHTTTLHQEPTTSFGSSLLRTVRPRWGTWPWDKHIKSECFTKH